jgi:anti-anti-sigma factor
MSLTVSAAQHGGHAVLVVAGELDLATAPQLADTALAMVDASVGDLVVDAGGLTFCDSSGLTAFVRVTNRLAEDGRRLAIAGAPPIVHRVLEISGLVEAITVQDTVSDAIAALAEKG